MYSLVAEIDALRLVLRGEGKAVFVSSDPGFLTKLQPRRTRLAGRGKVMDRRRLDGRTLVFFQDTACAGLGVPEITLARRPTKLCIKFKGSRLVEFNYPEEGFGSEPRNRYFALLSIVWV